MLPMLIPLGTTLARIGAAIAPRVMVAVRGAMTAGRQVVKEVKRNPVTIAATAGSTGYVYSQQPQPAPVQVQPITPPVLTAHTAQPQVEYQPTHRAPVKSAPVQQQQQQPAQPVVPYAERPFVQPPETVNNDTCIGIQAILNYVTTTPGYEHAVDTVNQVIAAGGNMYACEGFAYLQLHGKTTRLKT